MNIILVCNAKKLNNIYWLLRECYPSDNIDAFTSIAAALQHADGPMPGVDICFVEIMMKDASGFRVVEAMRRRDKRTKVVLIAPDDRFAMEGWRYGMNDYLIEPLNSQSIRHTLISCAPEDF